MSPRVTVGLPFFNNADTLPMAIRSVVAQSFEDWTLVLIDDGSTDNSLDLLEQIVDPRIVLLSDGTNQGLARRLNQLTELTETPLLARMDADDVMHPRRLEKQVAALDEHDASALVFSDAISIDARDRPTGYRRSDPSPSVLSHFRGSPYIHPTLLGRTDWFKSNGYDPSYRRCQDQELWVRTLGQQAVVALAEPLLYLREAGTVSASKYATSMAGTRRVLLEHGPRLLGATRTVLRVAETFVKQATYSVADRLGQADRVVRSRAMRISPLDESRHAGVIAAIRATPVRGLDR